MSGKLAWGILGTGMIARVFARGLAASATGTLQAVGSRRTETADAFGAEFGVPACYGSYDALLADPAVQAVYVATPHPQHAEWAVKAAEAGKHLLVEKPLTLNAREAEAVVAAARAHDVFLMEAFMYRCHPQLARVTELIRDGALGRVRLIQVSFSFRGSEDPAGRHLQLALGGGGILDVGCYCVSMARLLAGVAQGQAFAEPLAVQGAARLGATGVDEYATALFTFPGDIFAQLATGVMLDQENAVRVYGDDGWLLLPNPWFGVGAKRPATIALHRRGETEEIAVASPDDIWTLEADVVAAHLAARQAPEMTPEDSLGNMRALDRWRNAVGLRYPGEDA